MNWGRRMYAKQYLASIDGVRQILWRFSYICGATVWFAADWMKNFTLLVYSSCSKHKRFIRKSSTKNPASYCRWWLLGVGLPPSHRHATQSTDQNLKCSTIQPPFLVQNKDQRPPIKPSFRNKNCRDLKNPTRSLCASYNLLNQPISLSIQFREGFRTTCARWTNVSTNIRWFCHFQFAITRIRSFSAVPGCSLWSWHTTEAKGGVD